MTRRCAWCRTDMGRIGSNDDREVTHGICLTCSTKLLQSAGVPVPRSLWVGSATEAEAGCVELEVGI